MLSTSIWTRLWDIVDADLGVSISHPADPSAWTRLRGIVDALPFTWVLVFLLVAAIVVLLVFQRFMRRKVVGLPADRSDRQADPSCHRCGYDLRGLNFPRCPECGALRGFNLSVDELNLTEEERKLIDQRCQGHDEVRIDI